MPRPHTPITMPPVNQQPDRILDALLMQAAQEAIQRTRNPALRRDDPYLLDLRRQQYESMVAGYSNRRDLSREERHSLVYVRAQLRKLDARLHPTGLNRLRYWPPVDWLINWFRGRAALTAGFNRRLEREEQQITREQNVQRLSQELKKAGFTISMEGPLKRAIAQGLPYFYLPYAASDEAKTEYNLFFKKLPGTDTYYLEGFDAAAKSTVTEVLQGKNPIRPHHFSLIEEPAFTAPEAAHLVHQIPVAKITEGQEHWATLDAQGNRNWVNFDLERQLNSYPIKELQDPARRNALLTGLRSGTSREVRLIHGDNLLQKLKIQVDPHAESLLFKDSNGSLVDPRRLLRPNQNIEKIFSRTERPGIVRNMRH